MQRAVDLPAALRGTDGGSCHIRVHFKVPWYPALRGADNWSCYFQCMILPNCCGAGICLCLFLLLDVVDLAICAILGLVVGMTKQMSNGKEVDIVNC